MKWIYSEKVYLHQGIFNGSIGYEDGKIKQLYEGIHPEAIRYDKKRIIPGIIDTHNHGCYGWSMMDGISTDEVLEFLKAVASQGVTSIFPTTFPQAHEIGVEGIVEASKKAIEGAQIVGIHFEGPYLHRVGENGTPHDDRIIDLKHVQDIIDACEGKLKLMGHAVELEKSDELITLLKEKGVKAAITHTNADSNTAKHAIDQGIEVATHTGNVMTGIHHRDVGALGTVLLDDRVMCEAICDGMHISLDMVKMILKMKGYDKVMMISDCTALSGLKPGVYPSVSDSEDGDVIVTEDGFVKTRKGRLVGSSQPVMKGIENLVEKIGIPLEKVLLMSSYNQAKFYQLENKGYLDIDMDADFVVIDDDYSVIETYVLGNKVYQKGVTEIKFKKM